MSSIHGERQSALVEPRALLDVVKSEIAARLSRGASRIRVSAVNLSSGAARGTLEAFLPFRGMSMLILAARARSYASGVAGNGVAGYIPAVGQATARTKTRSSAQRHACCP